MVPGRAGQRGAVRCGGRSRLTERRPRPNAPRYGHPPPLPAEGGTRAARRSQSAPAAARLFT